MPKLKLAVALWIALDCGIAAFNAGWLWSYREAISATCADVSNLCWSSWL